MSACAVGTFFLSNCLLFRINFSQIIISISIKAMHWLDYMDQLIDWIHSQTQHKIIQLTLCQVESIWRWQMHSWFNAEIRFYMVENILGKEENAGNQYFLLFPPCILKDFSSGAIKLGIMRERVKTSNRLKCNCCQMYHVTCLPGSSRT